MPDKTPLENDPDVLRYARGRLVYCVAAHTHHIPCQHPDCRVAAALVERMTPVEVSLVGRRHGYCVCGQSVVTWYAFCVRCGNPLVWK